MLWRWGPSQWYMEDSSKQFLLGDSSKLKKHVSRQSLIIVTRKLTVFFCLRRIMAHNFYTKIGFAAIEAVVCFSSRWRWMNQQNQGGQGNGGALVDRQKCEIWHQLLRTYLESEWRNHIRSPPNVGQLQEGLTMLEVNQGDYGGLPRM